MRKKQDKINCSLARTIDVIGDRWNLLTPREAFFRVKRFDIFQTNLGIATNHGVVPGDRRCNRSNGDTELDHAWSEVNAGTRKRQWKKTPEY